jgi:hypothetical protein
MDFNKRFPLSRVYKITPHGLSLYTQEYVNKYLDEAKKAKEAKEDKEEKSEDKSTDDVKLDKEKFPKKSKINTEPDDVTIGLNQVA